MPIQILMLDNGHTSFTLQSYKNGIETLAWLKLTVTCFSNSNW